MRQPRRKVAVSVTLLRRVESSAHSRLMERLIEISRRDEALSCCLRVRVKREHVLSAVNFDTPVLVLLLQGHKRIRTSDGWLGLTAGEGFLVPQAMALDIENNPDPVSGWYTAVGISLDESVLGAARSLVREPVSESSRGVATIALDEHVSDLTAWLDELERGDLPRARYFMTGVVLRLYAQGHRGLLHPVAPTFSMRIRAMVLGGHGVRVGGERCNLASASGGRGTEPPGGYRRSAVVTWAHAAAVDPAAGEIGGGAGGLYVGVSVHQALS
jgi:hypothetical protein